MTVLVIGGASHSDPAMVGQAMERLLAERPFDLLLHLGRRGIAADAGAWAVPRRIQSGAGAVVREWDMRLHGENYHEALRSRANDLLRGGVVGLVVRFPGGDATDMLAAVARACGVEVVEVGNEPA